MQENIYGTIYQYDFCVCVLISTEDKGGKSSGERDQMAIILSVPITGCKKPSIVENDMYHLEMLSTAGNSCLNRINIT